MRDRSLGLAAGVFFSWSSVERDLYSGAGDLESWASLRLGRLPWMMRAGAAPLSRSGFRRGQLAADAAAAAGPRALLARLGLPGRGGGAGADPAPCLGVVLPRGCACVFWRFPSTAPI